MVSRFYDLRLFSDVMFVVFYNVLVPDGNVVVLKVRKELWCGGDI